MSTTKKPTRNVTAADLGLDEHVPWVHTQRATDGTNDHICVYCLEDPNIPYGYEDKAVQQYRSIWLCHFHLNKVLAKAQG